MFSRRPRRDTRAIADAVEILVASGGAGKLQHLYDGAVMGGAKVSAIGRAGAVDMATCLEDNHHCFCENWGRTIECRRGP